MSSYDEVVTIDGVEYSFQLLKLRAAMKIESKVIGLIAAVMGKSTMDHDVLYDVGVKICEGLLVDSFEIKDIDEHFKGKALLFNKVVIQGLKANFPDFFLTISKLGSDSSIKKALSESGLNL